MRISDGTNNSIHATALIEAFDRYSDHIQILSLDCFDTLLWRHATKPIDVFYDLQHRPTFKKFGISAVARTQAEKNARQIKHLRTGRSEVNLHDIYQSFSADLSQHDLTHLAADELAAEQETCYAFLPILKLIQHAHQKNKKIIIVSDIYFSKEQLKQLLQTALPAEIFQLIDKIYCSSDYGYSKSQGLFKLVLQDLNIQPQKILHIGDHPIADVVSAQKENLHALRLQQYDEHVDDMLRMQQIAANMFDPRLRYTKGMTNPYKAILASSVYANNEPEKLIGYAALGPILHAFATYVLSEVAEFQQANKRPKVVFLMRDGYLPSLACEVLQGGPIGQRVRISRFAAYAASFRSKEDIDKYLTSVVSSQRFDDVCKQLLLSEKISQNIIHSCTAAPQPYAEFIKQINQPAILNSILTESQKYRERLLRYVMNETNIQRGDTLVFVDLGYIGVTQQILEPIFAEMGIKVHGLYLIALRTPDWGKSRTGLLDPTWYDDRATYTLVEYTTLLEQVCTTNENSVIDYTEEGRPIFSDASVGQAQHKKLNIIQAECLRFLYDAKQYFNLSANPPTIDQLRENTLAALARFLFLPTQQEVQYLQSFQFDLNLGTRDMLKLFDEQEGLQGLRKRGLFFIEKNINSKQFRTNYPAELRSAGLELVLTLMAHYRFGIEMNLQDMNLRREEIKLIIMNGQAVHQAVTSAMATFEGYYSMVIPVSISQMQLGLVFGAKYKWLQLESAELIDAASLYKNNESFHSYDIKHKLLFDGMIDRGGGVYECTTETGLMLYSAEALADNQKQVLRIIFRPLLSREAFAQHESRKANVAVNANIA